MNPLAATAIPMPDPLVHYWTMWNEPDLGLVRGHLDLAVSEDVLWTDPQHAHVGRDALEANVIGLRTAKPAYRFVIASEIDAHHDRYRYHWHMMRRHRVLLRGMDIATVNSAGLICRVDGFFGAAITLQDTNSGVPDRFRFAAADAGGG
ncbi:MAG: nuclear transport factor 2 family protein [Actinomycetota bacterium]